MEKKKRSRLKKAAALRYKAESDSAPKVVAKGRGGVAERIIAVAKENDIPIHEDRDLIEILSTLELEQEIPPELYRTIAEILAFIYRVNHLAGGGI
ncbi:MAG: EscU/YscU/HrcU family type III secretion system export apparatus switch protein [Nitrospinota bacterium]